MSDLAASGGGLARADDVYAPLLAASCFDAARAASELARACLDPDSPRERLVVLADAVLSAAGRVRGFAFLTVQEQNR